jgi:predicted Zn-ribbon and HTH transcriptional regulator
MPQAGKPQCLRAKKPLSFLASLPLAFELSAMSFKIDSRHPKPKKWTTMPTLRQKIISLLSEAELSAWEISGEVGISEKEVCAHLSHIARSVASQNKRVLIAPATCLKCGYVFEERRRFTRPGRCPQCKKSHIQSPTFRIS